jgi:hypothetical protein
MDYMTDKENATVMKPMVYKEQPVLRYYKKMDYKNRIVIPKVITDRVNSDEFYVEYDGKRIILVPIKKQN